MVARETNPSDRRGSLDKKATIERRSSVDSGSPEVGGEKASSNLAELKMLSVGKPGYLRVSANVIHSTSYPPLGLFLFEAMIINQGYLNSNALKRLSMTSSFRR